jgi:hypothetical protein
MKSFWQGCWSDDAHSHSPSTILMTSVTIIHVLRKQIKHKLKSHLSAAKPTLTAHHPTMSTSKSPAANPSITPDPVQNGSTIRKAFVLEAIANLFTIPLVTNTRFVLSFLLLHPSDINASSILFARLFGGLVVGGLTSALLAGATNTRNGIESRRPTYMLLGLGEACLLPILAIEASKGSGRDAALSVKVAVVCMGMLAPPLLWRLYVLCVRPDLLGRYTETKEDVKGVSGTKCE